MKTILRPSGEDSFLKDAIRDLVIVVVGILAALWLESWWQDQQDRREEHQILSNLRIEFEMNNADLADVIRSMTANVNRIDSQMLLIDGPINKQTKSRFSALDRIGGPRFFDPRHGQLTSVINSGRLSLISNNELRGLIADWPALASDMDFERIFFIEIMAHGFGETDRRHVAPLESKFESDIDALIGNLEYYNELRHFRTILNIMLRESHTVTDTTTRIIELIDLELEER